MKQPFDFERFLTLHKPYPPKKPCVAAEEKTAPQMTAAEWEQWEKQNMENAAELGRSAARIITQQESEQTPYPWCPGNPTKQDCILAGYCRKNPNCGE
jgi:hypothetical protein